MLTSANVLLELFTWITDDISAQRNYQRVWRTASVEPRWMLSLIVSYQSTDTPGRRSQRAPQRSREAPQSDSHVALRTLHGQHTDMPTLSRIFH